MIKESNLPKVTSISNDDFFRLVTSAGLSKDVLGSVVKAFIGADTITKVNDYYYFQDASTPVSNDYRIYSNNVYLDFERYSGTEWVQQFRMGGSAYVKDFLELTKNPNADLLVNEDGVIRNLIRANSWNSGTLVGDIKGNTIIVSQDEIKRWKPIETFNWKVMQSDYSTAITGTSFVCDLTTNDIDAFISNKIKLKLSETSTQTIVQIKVYKSTDLVNPIWKNIGDAELGCECNSNFDPTTGIITFEPAFFGYGNEGVRIELNFIESISLLGDGTNFYFESYDSTVKITEINVFGTEFENFQSLDESTAGTTWTDKVSATTEIKPIGTYRIGFQCEITETGASEEVRFMVNDIAIHNHTTGNDELEPNLETYNWTTISGLYYITLISESTIDINIQHKDSGYGKMSNASIEIWRVK